MGGGALQVSPPLILTTEQVDELADGLRRGIEAPRSVTQDGAQPQLAHVPFWIDDHPPPSGLSSNLPARCDVVVVGSGYTGLAAARRLVRSGHHVVILEAGGVASGASSVNAGMVSPDVKRGVMVVARERGMQSPKRSGMPPSGRSTWSRRSPPPRESTRGGAGWGWPAGLTERPDAIPALRTEAAWFESEMGYPTEVVGHDQIEEVVGRIVSQPPSSSRQAVDCTRLATPSG